ncbi:MAG: hypothetical protein JG776_2445 [Caloramator sp.]|nr:hypothetical protein [Caloramator sp.]
MTEGSRKKYDTHIRRIIEKCDFPNRFKSDHIGIETKLKVKKKTHRAWFKSDHIGIETL